MVGGKDGASVVAIGGNVGALDGAAVVAIRGNVGALEGAFVIALKVTGLEVVVVSEPGPNAIV
jgi:hypothetical protein